MHLTFVGSPVILSVTDFTLTLILSPRREQRHACAADMSGRRFADQLTTILPLLWEEGRGEGKGNAQYPTLVEKRELRPYAEFRRNAHDSRMGEKGFTDSARPDILPARLTL